MQWVVCEFHGDVLMDVFGPFDGRREALRVRQRLQVEHGNAAINWTAMPLINPGKHQPTGELHHAA